MRDFGNPSMYALQNDVENAIFFVTTEFDGSFDRPLSRAGLGGYCHVQRRDGNGRKKRQYIFGAMPLLSPVSYTHLTLPTIYSV